MLKKISYFIILSLATNLVLSGCDSQKITLDDIRNTAIKAIMQHDNLSKYEIMIEKIDNVNEGVWQILFQEKLNGKWASGGNGNYYLEIRKDSNGNLKANFIEYKKNDGAYFKRFNAYIVGALFFTNRGITLRRSNALLG